MTGGRGARAAASALALLAALAASERPGVAPVDPWTCPASHPIKGYVSQAAGRVYHVPGGRFYEEASPERCYASEEEARRDGGVPAHEPRPAPHGREAITARPPDPRDCPSRSTSRRSS